MAERSTPEVPGCWSRAGVGCVTSFAGFWSGGMIGVMLGEIIGFFWRVPDCTGIPVSCNWAAYAAIGALIGAVSLPALAFWRLRRSAPRDGGANGQSDRG